MPLGITTTFFYNQTAPPKISTLSLHAALPICQEIEHLRIAVAGLETLAHQEPQVAGERRVRIVDRLVLTHHAAQFARSEEHTSELQSHSDLVCRLLLEKKKQRKTARTSASLVT